MHETVAVMGKTVRRLELSAFLRAHRSSISPESVGIPRGARRRTAGLRREELATLAEVGLTWYTWLEQGRAINISDAALGRIAKTLRLSEADHRYMFALAGACTPNAIARLHLDSPTLSMMKRYHGPAVAMDGLFELLAYNQEANALFNFEASIGHYRRNQLWNLFLNPERRSLYPNYSVDSRNFVELFRAGSAHRMEDIRYRALVDTLLEQSSEFAQIWRAQLASPMAPRAVELTHAKYGRLLVTSVRYWLDPGATAMVVLLAPEDEATSRAFDSARAEASQHPCVVLVQDQNTDVL